MKVSHNCLRLLMLGASQPTSIPSNHVTYRQGLKQDGAVTQTLGGEEASSEKYQIWLRREGPCRLSSLAVLWDVWLW